MTVNLGRVGVWCGPLRRGDLKSAIEAVRVIESLGFRTAWMPGGEDGLEGRVEALLGSTSALQLATGIVNIWDHSAKSAADLFKAAEARHPGRLLLGLGIGHEPLVNRRSPGRYRRPLTTLEAYLDDLDGGDTVPVPRRVLAAFGPRMMRLAGQRTAGAHPYLVTPAHAAFARRILGDDLLLAPEQHVVLERDPGRARAVAREYLQTYWSLPHYLANFRRMGFGEADFADGGSDRLVDALVAWGPIESIVARIDEHLVAGADHVAVQVLVPGRSGFPIAAWEELADAVRRPGAV